MKGWETCAACGTTLKHNQFFEVHQMRCQGVQRSLFHRTHCPIELCDVRQCSDGHKDRLRGGSCSSTQRRIVVEKPIYEATNWVAERVETAERQDQQCTQKEEDRREHGQREQQHVRPCAEGGKQRANGHREDGGSVMVSLQRAQTCGGDGSREQLLGAVERAEVVGGE